MKNNISIICLILFLLDFNFVLAQNDTEDLSKQAANPLADLMSFPFQNNLNMNYGEYNRNVNVLNIQTQLYYNVIGSDFGPEWQWRFQVQILLPKSIFSGKNKS